MVLMIESGKRFICSKFKVKQKKKTKKTLISDHCKQTETKECKRISDKSQGRAVSEVTFIYSVLRLYSEGKKNYREI